MNALELSKLSIDEELRLVERTFLASAEKKRVVIFSGLESRCGCTSMVTRAARRLASEVRGLVCVVDANLRRPALHTMFDVQREPGLVQALSSDAPIREFVQRVPHKNLFVLSSGGSVPDSRRVLSSDNLVARVKELSDSFDYVLFDSPAMDEGADATLLAQHTQGAVLVIGANSTKRSTAENAAIALDQANVPIIGAVLNKRKYPIPEAIYRWL